MAEITVNHVVSGEVTVGGTIYGIINGGGGGTPKLQEKTATPGNIQQVVTPDSGFDGLSKVTVAAARLENKTVHVQNSMMEIINPSEGNYGMSSVTLYPDLQTKEVTPTDYQQFIMADSGYCGLRSVTVAAATGGGGTLNTGINDDIAMYSYYGNTGIDEVIMPNVTNIGSSAFESSAFKTVRITNTASGIYIDGAAFKNSGLKNLYLHSSAVVNIGASTVFSGVTGLTVHVPASLLSSYQNDSIWRYINCTWVGDL